MDESSYSEIELNFINEFCKVVSTFEDQVSSPKVLIDPRVELPITYSICFNKAHIPYIHNHINTDGYIDGEQTLQLSPLLSEKQREYITKVFQLLFKDIKIEVLENEWEIKEYCDAYFGYITHTKDSFDLLDVPLKEFPVTPKPPVIDLRSDQYEYYISEFYDKVKELILPHSIEDYEISINDKMDIHDMLNNLIRSSNIKYTFYCCPRDIHQGYRNSLCFDWQTDINVIKYVTTIFKILFTESPWAKESYPNNVNFQLQFLRIYIVYGKIIEGKSNIYFGQLQDKVTNISKWITYNQIQNIDANNFDKSSWLKLYPPVKSYKGSLYKPCQRFYEYSSDYNEYPKRRYREYGGYNDWSDQDINDAFDGRPDATWNID